MKRGIIGILIIMSMSLVGCSSTKEKSDNIEIKEDMYITWINEIYENKEDYIGKKIKLEGMYHNMHVEEEKKDYNLVYRNGPGCCADDEGVFGLEFEYGKELPSENDWIEVEGTLGYYEVDGQKYTTIKDAKVTIKDERGAETLSQ